jgi:DNA-binding transcriptional MerR regulator
MTEEPLYNIGIVTRLTGISIPTLHAWERRYGYPKIDRSPGGHRLYSEKDIARLRWVKSQVDSGLSASRAIHAVRSLEEGGQFFPPVSSLSIDIPSRITPSQLQDALYEALVQHDTSTADRLMGEMLAFFTPEDLTINIIGPTLARIGEAWEMGKINVATEHLAANYLRHRLLMWMVTGPAPHSLKPVILACAPGEWHEGSLLIVGVLLRRRGWSVAYLGQNVPLQGLSDFIREISPSAILFVAMQAETAQNLVGWSALIKQVSGNPPILLGGRAFVIDPGLLQVIPGLYLGDTIEEGVLRMESILQGTLTPRTPAQHQQ